METFENLVSNLTMEDPVDRVYAVEDLLELGDLRAIEAIAKHIEKDNSLQVRETMLTALETLCAKAINPIAPLLYSDSPQIRNGAVSVLHKATDSVIQLLDHLSQDPDKDIRKFALDALKGKQSAASTAILRRGLEDEEANVRITAIEYLGDLDDKESSYKIFEILKGDSAIMEKASCLEALAKINNPEIGKTVIEFYSDYKSIPPMLLFSYLKLLGKSGNSEHFHILKELISNQGILLAKELIDATESICLREKIEKLPESIIKSLHELYDKVDSKPLNYEIFRFLVRQSGPDILEMARSNLDNKEPMIQLGSLEAIAKYGISDDLSKLKSYANQVDDPEVLEMINYAMESINKRLAKE